MKIIDWLPLAEIIYNPFFLVRITIIIAATSIIRNLLRRGKLTTKRYTDNLKVREKVIKELLTKVKQYGDAYCVSILLLGVQMTIFVLVRIIF